MSDFRRSNLFNIHKLHQIPEALVEPYNYIDRLAGKGVRDSLITAINAFFHLETNTIDQIRHIIHILHNASLLIDDIEDDSKMRRGSPVAHSIYGIPLVLNCANYVIFAVLELVQSLPQGSHAVQIFSEEILNLNRGQGWDIYWREHSQCPTEEEYYQMIKDKTGGLFRLAFRLIQSSTPNVQPDIQPQLLAIIDNLGLYFQIRDDYLNLNSAKYMENKIFCEDIQEGKFSHPIIHSIRSSLPDDKEQLISILRLRTSDTLIKEEALSLIKKTKSFEYTCHVLDDLKDKINQSISSLGQEALPLSQIMSQLSIMP